jgi:hypothetical protein
LENAEATPARMTNLALPDHVGIRRHLFVSRREGYLPTPSIGLRNRQHLDFTKIIVREPTKYMFCPCQNDNEVFWTILKQFLPA